MAIIDELLAVSKPLGDSVRIQDGPVVTVREPEKVRKAIEDIVRIAALGQPREKSLAQWLIRAIRSTLQANNAGEDGVEEALQRLAEQDTSASAFTVPVPRRLPACRFLPDVVASALLVAPDVAAALAAAEEDLHWAQNPNYSDDAMGQPHYRDGFRPTLHPTAYSGRTKVTVRCR